jgi:hypothetical protein
VSFGPNKGTFFAWDHKSFRWSKIPAALEEIIQDSLIADGWKYGPPVMVSFGPKDLFCIQFSYGYISASLRIPMNLASWIGQSNVNVWNRLTIAASQSTRPSSETIYGNVARTIPSILDEEDDEEGSEEDLWTIKVVSISVGTNILLIESLVHWAESVQ